MRIRPFLTICVVLCAAACSNSRVAAPRQALTTSGLALSTGSGPELRLEPGTSAPLVLDLSEQDLGFEVGRATPTDVVRAEATIAAVATRLRTRIAAPGASVLVTGWASTEGTVAANQRLSAARAQWICDRLSAVGAVPSTLLSCVGAGTHDVEPMGPGPEDRHVTIAVR